MLNFNFFYAFSYTLMYVHECNMYTLIFLYSKNNNWTPHNIPITSPN